MYYTHPDDRILSPSYQPYRSHFYKIGKQEPSQLSNIQPILINDHIHFEFSSILKILLHFSVSLLQLFSTFAILALQIVLTVTNTCAYKIGVGFWSFPILCLAPISIWLLLWKQNANISLLTFIFHFISTIFSTAVIIVSFIALLQNVEHCTNSNYTYYFYSLNGALIGVAIFSKLIHYLEIILLYILLQKTQRMSATFIDKFHQKNYYFSLDNDSSHNTRITRKTSVAKFMPGIFRREFEA
ncbi:unnamed protein product [Didymodactylos carnosus]|uniref:Uncharacterized protein n=1 Tax=Didymodactylos carnosus TaxID=1234261 RepID=A0A813P9Y6_9BILA|nr:unnamed protein product [Didymodactylos carnosus]CAF0978483.1 unnamed protein product [Didymodactylos carnosus]CAF3531384.1 unnamed protein product [Didymodactylos carnosus]CAF3749094.1 unnamed protein product [Didymodactylos carnosus]